MTEQDRGPLEGPTRRRENHLGGGMAGALGYVRGMGAGSADTDRWLPLAMTGSVGLAAATAIAAPYLPTAALLLAVFSVLALGLASVVTVWQRLVPGRGDGGASPVGQPDVRALEILYRLVSNTSEARSRSELIEHFLQQIIHATKARAAAVRLLDEGGEILLIGASGLSQAFIKDGRQCPKGHCACPSALYEGRVRRRLSLTHCVRSIGQQPLADGADAALIAIPIVVAGRSIGIYNLFLDPAQFSHWAGSVDLLMQAGSHLGASIERLRDDRIAHWRSISEERRILAHELHDSVAQSLAALRIRIRQMEQAMDDPREARRLRAHTRRLRQGINRSYSELRSLMGQFRGLIDGEGLGSALERLVTHCRRESGIDIRLINEWQKDCLDGDQELQVLRIVQEALNNARQHSGAANARVLLKDYGTEMGILIEDDGCGFEVTPSQPQDSQSGYHLGLAGLHERARRLGGYVDLETEPGEGTRVRVLFPAPTALGAVDDNNWNSDC